MSITKSVDNLATKSLEGKTVEQVLAELHDTDRYTFIEKLEKSKNKTSYAKAICKKCGKVCARLERFWYDSPESEPRLVRIKCDCYSLAEIELLKQKEKFTMNQNKQNSGIFGTKFSEVNFDNLDKTRVSDRIYEKCKSYSQKFLELPEEKNGLLLYGGTGTGKTYLACCIVNEAIKNGVKAKFIRVNDYIKNVADKKALDELDAEILDSGLVVLDDLSASRTTDASFEILLNLIDKLNSYCMPTVVTTNANPKAMVQDSDIKVQRIYSRVCGMCHLLEVKGGD